MIKTFNMATTPDRIYGGMQTLISIYDQADKIRVYLNNFTEVPNELINDKVEVYIGEDLNATGKLFWALNQDEYYFCIDDDILYPETYSEDMIKSCNVYNDFVFLTHHGKIMNSGKINSYYYDIKEKYQFLQNITEDHKVQIVGNGVSMFNTNEVKIDYKKFKYLYMDDIEVSIQLQEQNIPAISLKHSSNYFINNPPTSKTLYDTWKRDHSTQTERVNSIKWKI